MLIRKLLPGLFFVFATASWALSPAIGVPVRQDLKLGRANDALQRLDGALIQDASDAEGHNLRCRVYYQEELWGQAMDDCLAAVNLEPANSNYHLWLGRVYGRKASQVSLVSAYQLARKVAAQFQQAVRLDAHNIDALSDLGEFDVEAPAMVGGGLRNAVTVLQQLQGVDPVAALALEARIAEAKRDLPAAEADFKAAVAKSPHPASAWMDLAAFYQRHKRLDDMVTALHNGVVADPGHGPALVEAASDLAKAGVDQRTAIQWLQEYLRSHAQSEDAPAFAVHAQLAKLLQNEGNADGAQQQFAAVHALASGYQLPGPNIAFRAGQ